MSNVKLNSLIHTSVSDCKATIAFIDDIEMLLDLAQECDRYGHTSRAQVVRRRIRQVQGEKRKQAPMPNP